MLLDNQNHAVRYGKKMSLTINLKDIKIPENIKYVPSCIFEF